MEPSAQLPAQLSGSNVADLERKFSFREKIQLALITWTATWLIRLIGPTLRYTFMAEPDCRGNERGSGPICIWTFWHRCVIAATHRCRDNQIAVMTSRSFDGEYIARIIRKFGFIPVRGSSSRGAVGALMGMRRELEEGHSVAFTIDGPRGPRYVAKPGPVMLAKKSGVPIGCFYIHVESAWVLNSWDRMMVPKPFSRAVFYASSPIFVPADADDEQMTLFHAQMQEALERCRLKAEEALSK
ncbi:MAG TPA: lysophospholipid acyltransferase family protein [Candidatus Acidoferrales bacterium]|nr:lysophospholipid acyltransferase family protein [Candidatus Acidoferrales bacterium]